MLTSDRRKARQQVGNLLRRKEFPALFARVGGVHTHQILVSIAEGVDRAVLILTELHIGNGIEELYELFVALGDRRAQLVGIDVEIVEQPFEGVLALAPLCRIFDIMKDAFERFIERLILRRPCADVAEQLGRQNEKALLFDKVMAGLLCFFVGQTGIIKIGIARLPFPLVDVFGDVFRNVAIKHRAEDVLLKVPRIDAARMDEVGRRIPDHFMELCALLLFPIVCHRIAPYIILPSCRSCCRTFLSIIP